MPKGIRGVLFVGLIFCINFFGLCNSVYAQSSESLSDKQALTIVWGNYDPIHRDSLWKNVNPPANEEFNNIDYKVGVVSVELLQQYTDAGKEKYFLLTKTVPAGQEYSCHVCAPLMSAIVFAKVGDKWKVESQNLYLTVSGTFGKPPESSFIQIGKDKYGVMLEDEDMHQGLFGKAITLVAPYDGKIEKIFQQESRIDNFSACGSDGIEEGNCWGYMATIEFNKNVSSEFFNIRVREFGTVKNKNGKTSPIDNTKNYYFSGGKYVAAKQ